MIKLPVDEMIEKMYCRKVSFKVINPDFLIKYDG